jgi:hypothetical protein
MAPIFLSRAYYSTDKLERLKWITTYLFSQLHLSSLQSKPFNPIIGETLQMKIANLDLYYEQTVNKPPTCCFHGISPLYTIHGSISIEARTGANSCKAYKSGNYFIEFCDGQKYELIQAPIILKGINVGVRTFNYRRCSLVYDRVSFFTN